MRVSPLLLLLACGQVAQPVASTDPLVVRSWLEDTTATGGVLVVQTVFDATGQVEFPQPESEGLNFGMVGDPVLETLGRQQVLTQRYRFTGSQGHHEIAELGASWVLDDQPDSRVDVEAQPLFVSITSPPPREGDLADIIDPDRIWTVPWLPLAVVGGTMGLLGVSMWFVWGSIRRFDSRSIEAEPPDLVALRQWDAIRSDEHMDDEFRAQGASRIFREYSEAVLLFPASSWTTSEIVRHLKRLAHLPQGNLPRAKRLLRATDRLKFAGESARADLFDELDSDLRAFVASTRPSKWKGDS